VTHINLYARMPGMIQDETNLSRKKKKIHLNKRLQNLKLIFIDKHQTSRTYKELLPKHLLSLEGFLDMEGFSA